MGTRSNIGIEYEDGSVKFVYCHWDGYPSNNGEILFNNYHTKNDVEALVALGSISSLDSSPSSTKDYHTWRNEEIVIQEEDHRNKSYQEEYSYIFSVKDNTWYVKGATEEKLWYIKDDDSYEGWVPLERVLDE
jgi:hypothetical protein